MSNSNVQVVDPKLAAGRGVEFSAAHRRAQEDELLELAALDGHDVRWVRVTAVLSGREWCVTPCKVPQMNEGRLVVAAFPQTAFGSTDRR